MPSKCQSITPCSSLALVCTTRLRLLIFIRRELDLFACPHLGLGHSCWLLHVFWCLCISSRLLSIWATTCREELETNILIVCSPLLWSFWLVTTATSMCTMSSGLWSDNHIFGLRNRGGDSCSRNRGSDRWHTSIHFQTQCFLR